MDEVQADDTASDLTLLLTVGEWMETMMQELEVDSSSLTSSRLMSKANKSELAILLAERCEYLSKQNIAM